MDERLLNRELTYMTYVGLMDLYKDYKNPKDKIKNLIKKKEIIRVKRNLYILAPKFKKPYSKYVLANLIYGPSAISFESALSYYGMIPERVEAITSICFKKIKHFHTLLGLFTYRYISSDKFPIGINYIKSNEGNFFIASPEKALCDLIYHEKFKNRIYAREYILQNLRIDEMDLISLNQNLLFNIARIYDNQSVFLLVNEFEKIKKEVQSHGFTPSH